MPQSLYNGVPNLSVPAWNIFNSATTGQLSNHGWSKEHKQYNEAVRDLWDNYLRTNRIDPSKMTAEQANRFLDQIKNATDPRIKDFLRDVHNKRVLKQLRGMGKALGIVGACATILTSDDFSDWLSGMTWTSTLGE